MIAPASLEIIDPAFAGEIAPLVLEREAALLAEEIWRAAALQLPTLRVDARRFLARVVRASVVSGAVDVATLAVLRGPDLYLAEGCAQHDPASLSTFEVLFARDFDVVFARVRQSGADRDDFAQSAREKLFVRGAIADYGGLGDLRHWLRVLLTRTLLDSTRKRTEIPSSTATTEEPSRQPFTPYAPEVDPELEYMKAHYRDAFRAAFERAARSLDAEERNILRQHFAHGLGIDRLANLLNVHRATAARKIARARTELLHRTRAELSAALGIGARELDSVMRYVESQVHVSVERVLGADLEA